LKGGRKDLKEGLEGRIRRKGRRILKEGRKDIEGRKEGC
jgi:hypothetical protein